MNINYDNWSKEKLIKQLQETLAENKQLKELNEFTYSAFREAPLAAIKMSPDGIVLQANNFAFKFFGYADTFIGSNIMENSPQEQADKVLEQIRKLTPEDNIFYQPVFHVMPSKRIMSFIWCYAGVFNNSGQVDYLIGYCFPPDFQEGIAQQLRSQLTEEKKLQKINKNIVNSILQMLLASSNTLTNQNILQLINEHFDADASALLKHIPGKNFYCQLQEVVLTKRSTLNKFNFRRGIFSINPYYLNDYKKEMLRIHYWGDEYLNSSVTDFFNRNNFPYKSIVSIPILIKDEFYGILVTVREHNSQRWNDNDLSLFSVFSKSLSLNTERIEIQNELEREQRLTTLALEKSEVYSWEYDVEKDIYYNNELLLKRYGYPMDQQPVFNFRMFLELLHPDDRNEVEAIYANILKGNEPEGQLQSRVKIIDSEGGHYEWFQYKFMVLKRPGSNKVVNIIGTGTCIDRFKQIEFELIGAKEQAEESSQLKTAFLANISHEIRTPLNAIVGFSEILMETENKSDKEEYIKIIRNNNELLLNLINDILDISRIESGKMEFVNTEVDVNELLDELEQSARLRVTKPNINIKVEKGLAQCNMDLERSRTTQVFMNLINNAIKFTEQGSITIGYRLTKDKKDIYFYVRDTGCGIPEDKLESIFERFIKLNSFVQGTGLGLSISKTIVKKMHGEIGVVSEPGKGSEFWFTLPYTAYTSLSK